MAASAAFTANGTAAPSAVAVAPGATVNLALTSTTDVQSIAWSIASSSDSAVAVPTITPAGVPSGATASFTFPSQVGHAVRVFCNVNQGEATAECVVGSRDEFGFIKLTLDEKLARDATQGWLPLFNNAIGGGGNRGTEDTTDATVTTIATIATESDMLYLVGAEASSRDASNNAAFELKRFVYTNIGGTLAQLGSDEDSGLNTDDITLGGLTHTTSGTNILLRFTGKASTNIRTRHFYQVYRKILDAS